MFIKQMFLPSEPSPQPASDIFLATFFLICQDLDTYLIAILLYKKVYGLSFLAKSSVRTKHFTDYIS